MSNNTNARLAAEEIFEDRLKSVESSRSLCDNIDARDKDGVMAGKTQLLRDATNATEKQHKEHVDRATEIIARCCPEPSDVGEMIKSIDHGNGVQILWNLVEEKFQAVIYTDGHLTENIVATGSTPEEALRKAVEGND